MALVDRLRDAYPSLEKYLADNGLKMLQGYNSGDRSRPVPEELRGLPWLARVKLPPFHLDAPSLPMFQEEWLEHSRDREIFRGPLLLVAARLRGNRLVAAVCGDDVVYSLSYCGIPMGRTDPTLTHYLNGILNSSLAAYFVFLTATKWGIEKYEILENDYLRLPIPEMANPTRLRSNGCCRSRGGCGRGRARSLLMLKWHVSTKRYSTSTNWKVGSASSWRICSLSRLTTSEITRFREP